MKKNKTLFEIETIFTMVLSLVIALTQNPLDMLAGYGRILTHQSNLLVDYTAVGGLQAAFFNAFVLLLFNVIVIKLSGSRISGLIFAGLMTIFGFSLLGKNVLNVAPIYLGIYLYTRFKEQDFKKVLLIALFATGAGPVVSVIMFGIGIDLMIAVPLAILVGIAVGFILPPLVSHTVIFHMGYSLYNVGFVIGFIAMSFNGMLKMFGYNVEILNVTSTEYHFEILFIALFISLVFILMGVIAKPDYKAYPKLLKRSGRAVANFEARFGAPITLINCGLLGILSILAASILNITINGVIFAGFLTVMGFGTFGKHLRNTIPIMIGYAITVMLSVYSFESSGTAVGLFFVTGLAPVAGRFGFVAGLFTGFVHLSIVILTAPLYGGMDLYNNGFATGLGAMLLVVVITNVFHKEIE
jgi:hypothetical protein